MVDKLFMLLTIWADGGNDGRFPDKDYITRHLTESQDISKRHFKL